MLLPSRTAPFTSRSSRPLAEQLRLTCSSLCRRERGVDQAGGRQVERGAERTTWSNSSRQWCGPGPTEGSREERSNVKRKGRGGVQR